MNTQTLIETELNYEPAEFFSQERRSCWEVRTEHGEKLRLVLLDGLARGAHTLFLLSDAGQLYYSGENPETCSDGMCIVGDWVDAIELPLLLTQQRIEKFDVDIPDGLREEVDWCDDYELCKGCERAYRDQGSDLCGLCNGDNAYE